MISKSALDAEMARLGVQCKTVTHPGPPWYSVADLCKIWNTPRSTAKERVAKLLAKGMLIPHPDNKDRGTRFYKMKGK